MIESALFEKIVNSLVIDNNELQNAKLDEYLDAQSPEKSRKRTRSDDMEDVSPPKDDLPEDMKPDDCFKAPMMKKREMKEASKKEELLTDLDPVCVGDDYSVLSVAGFNERT